jgi:hypothetical protein
MTNLPSGYRQGFITAITVLLTASLLYFRFVVFEPASGDWTKLGAVTAVLAGISICIQLVTLWRALQPEDEEISVYKITLRWFRVGIVILVGSFVANVVGSALGTAQQRSSPSLVAWLGRARTTLCSDLGGRWPLRWHYFMTPATCAPQRSNASRFSAAYVDRL